jgi:hypothetical protein
MKTLAVLSLLAFVLFGCSESTRESEFIAEETTDEVLRLDNPSLFMGSSFGEFLQMNHKLGDYQRMLQFTSSQTRKRFTDPVLVDFFKRTQFSYPLGLRSKSEEKGLITLFYGTTIDATQRTIQMNVKIENDTCKLVLDKLDTEKPFIGM